MIELCFNEIPAIFLKVLFDEENQFKDNYTTKVRVNIC